MPENEFLILAGKFTTLYTGFELSQQATSTDLAHCVAVRRFSPFRPTAIANHIFRLNLGIKLGRPFCGDLHQTFCIFGLCGNVAFTRRTIQPTMRNHLHIRPFVKISKKDLDVSSSVPVRRQYKATV
jgi:hypothetical protein